MTWRARFTTAACLGIGLGVISVRPLPAQTLREVIAASGVGQPSDATDLDRSITSFAVLDDSTAFVIAYYWIVGDGRALDDSIRIRVLRKRDSVWQSRALPRIVPNAAVRDRDWQLGSALQMFRARGHIYVDTHLTPSAGTILVLTEDLQPVATLSGWVRAVGPEGLLIFQQSMVHFAPTHSAELWGFDSRAVRSYPIYPTEPYQPVRAQYIEEVRQQYERVGESWFRLNNHHMDPTRFDSSIPEPLVLDEAGERIAFMIRFGSDSGARLAAPVLDVVVVCTLIRTSPRCSEETLDDARRRTPQPSLRELLVALLGRR